MQRSLKGAAADTAHNIGAEDSLNGIIKAFTIIYGNVKSFDLLMRDFIEHIKKMENLFHALLKE